MSFRSHFVFECSCIGSWNTQMYLPHYPTVWVTSYHSQRSRYWAITLSQVSLTTEIRFRADLSGGEIPSRLFQLQNLTELDFEYTALTGPLPDRFDGMPALKSLMLVNNQQLGPSTPDLSSNQALATLLAGSSREWTKANV